jgi:hypothetical protein
MNYCSCPIDVKSKFGVSIADGKVICKKCNLIDPTSIQSINKKSQVARGQATRSKETQGSYTELIEAQDRTTHAVRSLAITFVAAPIIFIALFAGAMIAIQSQNTGAMIAMGIAALIITLGTVVSALNELSLSKV